MPAIAPRLLFENRLRISGSLLAASSEEVDKPGSRIRDPRRSKVWRSRTGWNIVAGVNDKLDLDEGTSGLAQATIPEGNFASGALMAATVELALNAVAVDNTYLVTYAGGTRFFDVARNVGADTFELPWLTGPGTLATIGDDLGYDTSADDTGALNYTSDFPTRKSAEVVTLDFLTPVTVQAVALLESNALLASGDVVTVQGDAVGDFVAPGFSQALVDGDPLDTTKLLAFFAAVETFRFWRFLIEDRDNPNGFSQIGTSFVGPFTTFNRVYGLGLPERREQLSVITRAEQGAIYTDVKPDPREYGFDFEHTDNPDREKWEEIRRAVKVGQHIFYAMDPLNLPLVQTLYGYVRPPGIQLARNFTFTDPGVPSVPGVPESDWGVQFPFSEAIG